MAPQFAELNGRKIIVNQTWAGIMAAYTDDIPFRNHVGNGAIFEQDMITDMIEPYIKRAKYIFDIGAHTGHHTVPYCRINPDAVINSFEPQPEMFALLQINVMNNKPATDRVQLFNMALGDKHGTAEMQKDTFGGTAYLGKGGHSVNCTTLDALNPKGCDYMKIDVEGYEPLVVAGATETIKKFRPFIVFEDNGSSKENGITDLDIHKMLRDLEYQIHELVYDNFLAVPLVKSKFKNCSGIVKA